VPKAGAGDGAGEIVSTNNAGWSAPLRSTRLPHPNGYATGNANEEEFASHSRRGRIMPLQLVEGFGAGR
jgi:hypothetical protein